jgi:beta-barrel assembly-enhancing protease
MEAEADMLGSEYAWAAGYDPNYLVTFFEKIEKKEKSKPGTLSKLFGTHPPTPDRVEKVKSLIARFPDREEYIINTSDFNKVKSRLLAVSNSRVVTAAGDRDSGPHRPTLKRRTDGTSDPSSTQPSDTGPQDRPTLKRRDSDTTTTKPVDPNKPADPTKDPATSNLPQ